MIRPMPFTGLHIQKRKENKKRRVNVACPSSSLGLPFKYSDLMPDTRTRAMGE